MTIGILKKARVKHQTHRTHRMNPNSLRNLRPQKAGEPSHNPKGRPPRDQTLIEYIRELLPQECPYDTKGRTWFEALAEAELRYALTDTPARKDLLDRLLGRPGFIDGEDGEPIMPAILQIVVSSNGHKATDNP